MTDILTAEEVSRLRQRALGWLGYGHDDPSKDDQPLADLCDSHEALRQQVATLTEERDEERGYAERYDRIIAATWDAVRGGLTPDVYREHKWSLDGAVKHRIDELKAERDALREERDSLREGPTWQQGREQEYERWRLWVGGYLAIHGVNLPEFPASLPTPPRDPAGKE